VSSDLRKKQPWYRPAASLRAETVVFATLGIVATATVLVAMVWGSVPAAETKAPLPAPQELPMVRYFTPRTP